MRTCKRIVSFALAAALMGTVLTAAAATAPRDMSENDKMRSALSTYLRDYQTQKGGGYTIRLDMTYPVCRIDPSKITDALSVRASADIDTWISTTATSDGDNPQIVVKYNSATKKYTVEDPTHDYDAIDAVADNISLDGNIVGTGQATGDFYDDREGYLCFGDVCSFVLAETRAGQPVAYAVGDTAKAFAGGKDVVSLDTLRYIAQLEYSHAVENVRDVVFFGLNDLPKDLMIPDNIKKPQDIKPVSLTQTSSSLSASSAVLSSLASASSTAAANVRTPIDNWMWVAIVALVAALGEGVWIIWRPAPKDKKAGGAPADGSGAGDADPEPEEDHTPRG